MEQGNQGFSRLYNLVSRLRINISRCAVFVREVKEERWSFTIYH